jgi:hypothetical protein
VAKRLPDRTDNYQLFHATWPGRGSKPTAST